MSRKIFAAIYWDAQLQFRNGFYYAAAFVTAIWIVLLIRLPDFDLRALLPAILLSNLLVSTFFFIAGLVLLEKGEGTLHAQAVTPLRLWQYLLSKILTLLALVLVENLVVIILISGVSFGWLPALAGLALASGLLILAGFAFVARYDSINSFLMPSILFTIFLMLPAFPLLGVGQTEWFYWHPMQACLVLLQAAFQPTPTWKLVYGLVYSLLWTGLAYRLCLHAHRKYILERGA